MRIVFRPEAKKELLEAQAWYEELSPGLGYEFARAVDASIARILKNLNAQSGLDRNLGQIVVRKFPYAIIYNEIETQLVVIPSVLYTRKPGLGLGNDYSRI